MRALLPALAVTIAAVAASSAPSAVTIRTPAALSPPVVVTDSLRLYYVGRAVGWEHYTFTKTDSGAALTADFDYIDRGRRTRTQAAATYAPDYAMRHLEIARVTDTNRTITAQIDVAGHTATFMRNRQTTTVELPANAFAVSSYTPTSQHLALIHFWEGHGRPASVMVIPGEPPNPVTIQRLGADTIGSGANRAVLFRYSIDGIVWGIEYLWVDTQGRLAMFASGGSGGLMLKSVRAELVPMHDALMDIAARAAMVDLVATSDKTKPIAEGSIAFVGATVIDATGAAPIPNATVVVQNGRITAVGPSAQTVVPAGARRIDVAGKTIVPGLWDSHAHVHQIEWPAAYFAAGVTSVRDMGGEWQLLTSIRRTINDGKAHGPNLFLAGLVDGPGPNGFGEFSAGTPEEGRAIVRRYHEMGFEMMKIYLELAPDVTGAICDEAHKLGMTVTGHIPKSMTLHAAIDSGMDQVAHFPVRGDLTTDSGRVQIAHFLAKKTIFDPTSSWGEIGGKSAQEPMQNIQPVMQHLPAPLIQYRVAGWGSATTDSATAHQRVLRSLVNVRAAHDAGVPIIAGTDEGVPAFSVYREIELYVKGGFTPMEALRSATAVAAKAMRVDKDLGTVERGKRADLLVLDANPLENISNIRTVRFVIKDGRMFDSAELWKAAGFKP